MLTGGRHGLRRQCSRAHGPLVGTHVDRLQKEIKGGFGVGMGSRASSG